MTLTSISSRLNTQPATNVIPPPPLFEVKSEKPPTPDQDADTTPQAKADQELAVLFAAVSARSAKTGPSYDGIESVEGIPPSSTFGQWWTHLHTLLKHPQFVEWATQRHINLSKPLMISLRDQITFTMTDGRREEFRATDENPLWPVVVAPILRAANVVAAGNSPLRLSASDSTSAPFEVVANFHGESVPLTTSRTAQLQQTQTFTKNAANAVPNKVEDGPANTGKLNTERTALGDLVDTRALCEKLKGLVRYGTEGIEERLKNTTIEVHPHSSFGQGPEAGPGRTVTLEQFILANNWRLPSTLEALENMISTLNAPPLQAPHLGSLGGAISWPAPLSDHDQKSVYSHFHYNLQLPALVKERTEPQNPRGVLGYLTSHLHISQNELRDPLKVIEKIINTPKAIELEAALHQKMGDGWKTSSSHDWLLTAIATTLDPESMFGPQLNHLAGFNLADGRFMGQPLATIKQAFIDHLIKLNRASPDMAPIAAQMLLSRTAPELLVKNVPASITLGSAAWVSFKAAVTRIEAYSPGATMQMTFAQVCARDALDPISQEGQAIQQVTSRAALIEWGKINGELVPRDDGNYPQADIDRVQRALADKTSTLQQAVEQLASKVPTQRDVALQQLKQQFGEGLPYELKCFRDNSPRGRGHGNLASSTQPKYSLLDFYLSKPEVNPFSNWVSDNNTIAPSMIARLAHLPDAKSLHKQAFVDYTEGTKKAQASVIKNQLAKLPLEDRKNLEFGSIRIFIEGQVSRYESNLPGFTINDEDKVPSQPKEQKALIFQTERDGNLEFYEISAQKGQINKRDDLKTNFKEGPQGDWVKVPSHQGSKWTNTAIHEVKPSASQDAVQQRARQLPVTIPASFSSARSAYISNTVVNYSNPESNFEQLLELTKSITTFDEEADKEKALFNIIVGLIPGASAVKNLINGDPLAALGDLLFDGVMYVTGSALGRGASAVGGPRGATRVAMASSRIGRGVLGKASGAPASSARLAAGTKPLNARQLSQSTMDHAQLRAFAERADIAEGTYRAPGALEPSRVTAQLDNKTGHWLHYDVNKNTAYGKKLDNFSPDNHRPISAATGSQPAPATAPVSFEKSLAYDNVIQMKGTMKDLKLVANEMHVFVDTYKGVDRLNIVAHGLERSRLDRFLNRGSSIVIDNTAYSAKDLVALLNTKGVDPSAFNNVRLLVCYSGEGGSRAFGSLLQKEINRPVKAFEGSVSMQHGSTSLTAARDDLIARINEISPGISAKNAERLADMNMYQAFVGKVTQHVVKTHGSKIKMNVALLGEPKHYVDTRVSYKPVYFR